MASHYYPGATEDDLLRLDALACQGLFFFQAFALLEGPTPKDVARRAYFDFMAYHGTHEPNPWALEDSLEADGLSLDTWVVPKPTPPKIDAENPAIHISHGCVTEPFIVSRCGIALDDDRRRSGEPSTGITLDDLCQPCLQAYLASPACPACGEVL